MRLLTTHDAAARLGVTERRVTALIQAGRLPAARYGPLWLIRPEDLKLVARRKPGRPAKRGRRKR